MLQSLFDVLLSKTCNSQTFTVNFCNVFGNEKIPIFQKHRSKTSGFCFPLLSHWFNVVFNIDSHSVFMIKYGKSKD